MRVRILAAFSTDSPPRRYEAGAEEEVPAAIARSLIDKGLAEEVGATVPEAVAEDPETLSWPALRDRATDIAGRPVRSRADAVSIIRAAGTPD